MLEIQKCAIADILARGIIWCPCHIAPDSVSANWQHRADTRHGSEDFRSFFPTQEFLEAVDSKGVELSSILHLA